MTDAELTRLAFKAAFSGAEISDDRDMLKRWSPLTDDGDALRLAVKLQMEVAIFEDECHTRCMEHGQRDWFDETGDPYAATRRAIVKAAAEIGKQVSK